jgi:hypothetical protein
MNLSRFAENAGVPFFLLGTLAFNFLPAFDYLVHRHASLLGALALKGWLALDLFPTLDDLLDGHAAIHLPD